MSRLEPQLVGLMGMFNGPVEKLDMTATSLQRNVEALPVLLLGDRTPKADVPVQPGGSAKPRSPVGHFFRAARSALANRTAWMASGALSFFFWFTVSMTILALGSAHLSRWYEQSFQNRIAHMEADSVTNTVTLNRLLAIGLAIKVERGPNAGDWFLVLEGARKVAAPVDSPEGPAVEVWR